MNSLLLAHVSSFLEMQLWPLRAFELCLLTVTLSGVLGLLSVVIPALNSASTIDLTLSSVFSSSFSRELFEVLVVDNGSSDATVEVAQRFPVRVEHCAERGIGPPRNLGIRLARGNIVCLTDSDCVVERNWLRNIWRFFEQNPGADGVGGPVLPYPQGQSKIQRLTGEIFLEDHRYPNRTKKVQFGSVSGIIFGSNSAFRKNVVTSAGGYSVGGSNLELAWRMVLMKRNLFFSPEIRVSHIFPSNLQSIFRQQFRWGAQSTSMRRMYHLDEGAKDIAFISYFLVRRLLSLAFPRDLEKKLLQLTQLASYSLGRICGLSL
jgi:glycosyltransferase involved in cell wall biosynthesis